MQSKKTLDKQEKQLYKKWLSCKKTKCALINKKKAKANKIFEKEQARVCSSIKNDMKYYNCTSKFLDKSTAYQNIVNEEKNCGDAKCSKEHQEYKNTFNAHFNTNSKGGMRKTNTKNKIKQKKTGENLKKEFIKINNKLENCHQKHCNDITQQLETERIAHTKQLETKCKLKNNN